MSYNGFGYDSESSIQDADIEMRELQDSARELQARIDAGDCPHYGSGPDTDKNDGSFKCYDCGRSFKDRAERDRIVGI